MGMYSREKTEAKSHIGLAIRIEIPRNTPMNTMNSSLSPRENIRSSSMEAKRFMKRVPNVPFPRGLPIQAGQKPEPEPFTISEENGFENGNEKDILER